MEKKTNKGKKAAAEKQNELAEKKSQPHNAFVCGWGLVGAGHGTKDEPKTKTLAQGNAVSWLKLKFPGNHSNALHTPTATATETHPSPNNKD